MISIFAGSIVVDTLFYYPEGPHVATMDPVPFVEALSAKPSVLFGEEFVAAYGVPDPVASSSIAVDLASPPPPPPPPPQPPLPPPPR